MKKVSVNINNSTYTLSFGISCLRLLGQMWQLNTINEVLEKLSLLDKVDQNNISFEFLDLIEDVFVAGIRNNPENKIVETDLVSIVDYLFENPSIIQEMTFQIYESMPKPKNEKKPMPAQKLGKK